MNFLGAVNRVLINNFILKGDDGEITAFEDLHHEGTIRVAINAVQTELNSLTSHFPIPYEKTTGTLTTVVDQRVYTLPTNFVRFFGSKPYLYETTDYSYRVYEYEGGEEKLRQHDYQYLNNSGFEIYWYWNSTTDKSIALYQIPDGVRTYSFEYEKDVSVTIATDTIPLHSEPEAQALSDMASRRFKYIIESQNLGDLENDVEYKTHHATLMNLIRHRNLNKGYGANYR